MTDSEFRPALLVIDMQEDFCPPSGALAVASGRDIIPLINRLLALPTIPLKIATKDWHPPNHVSFAANHPLDDGLPPSSSSSSPSSSSDANPHPKPTKRPFLDTTVIANPRNPSERYTTRLWPVHCVQHTPGASLVPELDVSRVQHVIEKGTSPDVEMYSAFCPPLRDPKVSDSGLAALLRENGTTHVYVVGLAGDYCVRSTAEDAVREGFVAYVVEEATKAVDPGLWEDVKKEMEEKGVRVVSVDGPEVRRLFQEKGGSE
ncbi:hypothetical protein VTJ83DRAFT_715 [Remersonia thermophila]|uniref:nicotinamidase n=1 Tax=Remersonia thermophila TaxID=72144 RepID=A0ABR4DLR8_9PEZI